MSFDAPDLPRGLNFADNRQLAAEADDTPGYCAQCGREDKAKVLAYNSLHSGHAVCYRCLKKLRSGELTTTAEETAAYADSGPLPWDEPVNQHLQEEADKSLPF